MVSAPYKAVCFGKPLLRCLQSISPSTSQQISGASWCALRISVLPAWLPDVSRKWESENGSKSFCSKAESIEDVGMWEGDGVRAGKSRS